MPSDVPRLGEFWRTAAGDTGVVSEVRDSTIIFISMTGVRFAVAWRKSLTDVGWRRQQESPWVNLYSKCLRQGCEREAFLAYNRPLLEETPELACPFHAPRGTQLRVAETGYVASESRSWPQCDSCKQDGFEVFGELRRSQQKQSGLWTCRYCGKWWMTTTVDHPNTLTNLTALLSIPEGYRLNGGHALEHVDPMTQQSFYRLALRLDGPKDFSGVKPKTFLDLIEDEL